MSATTNDYYKILGVARNASQKEIKSAWRRIVRETHPDAKRDESQIERFKSVSEAWEVLGDPIRRGEYDQQLFEIKKHSEGRMATTSGHQGPMADLFSSLFTDILKPISNHGFPPVRLDETQFRFPINDIGLLAALIKAYGHDDDGKWFIRQTDEDKKDRPGLFEKDIIYSVVKKEGKISVYRQIEDWRDSRSRGRPILQKDVYGGVTETSPAGTRFREDGFQVIGGTLFEGVYVDYGFLEYLRALKWIAYKIASGEKDTGGGYQVSGETQAINHHVRFNSHMFQPDHSRHEEQGDKERVVIVQYEDFFRKMREAEKYITQEGSRVNPETRQTSSSSGGENKG